MFNVILHILFVITVIYLLVCLIYFLIQEKFIFVPTLPGESFEIRLATHTEEFHLQTPHNGRIHALLLKVEKPKGLIFYLHGNTGSLKRWQFMAEEISGYGYDVFVLDYRGYGQSKGRKSEAIMHRDIEYCFDFITENTRTAEPSFMEDLWVVLLQVDWPQEKTQIVWCLKHHFIICTKRENTTSPFYQ